MGEGRSLGTLCGRGRDGLGAGEEVERAVSPGRAGQGAQIVSGGRLGAVCAKALRSGWQAADSLPPSTVLLVVCDIFLFYV